MAVSKNSRKKKRKPVQNHKSPVRGMERTGEREVEVQQKAKEKRALQLNVLGMAIMVAGFIVAWSGQRFIGYPITFCGSVMGLISTRMQEKGRKLTIVGYTLYSIMVAYLWIFEFLAP